MAKRGETTPDTMDGKERKLGEGRGKGGGVVNNTEDCSRLSNKSDKNLHMHSVCLHHKSNLPTLCKERRGGVSHHTFMKIPTT